MVYGVSALPNYSCYADTFYERELVPRFQEAQRHSAMPLLQERSACFAKLSQLVLWETFPSNRERRSPGMSQGVDLPEIESTLRVIAGEVGEQRTVLDHAFRRRMGKNSLFWFFESCTGPETGR